MATKVIGSNPWDWQKVYNVGNKCTYNGYLWTSIIQNSQQEPYEGSRYWKKTTLSDCPLITSGTFRVSLNNGSNLIRNYDEQPTSKVISGTIPTNTDFILYPIIAGADNDYMFSYNCDGSGSAIYIYTNKTQELTIKWISFNL